MIKKRGDDFKMGPKYIEIYDLVQASPDEYLMHHGIKNQKWGVRRGPPYPLESGIRTKIKKVTKAAKDRVKENQAKRAAKTAAKKQAVSEAKERKKNSEAEKKETIQDKINKMSDEELKARTNRLKLENDYRNELSKSVVKGKNFIEKSSDVLTTLKTGADALDGFAKSGKKLLQTLGFIEQKKESPKDSAFDWRQWRTRLPGESVQQYANRLESLSKIQQNESKLSKAEAAAAKQREREEEERKKQKNNSPSSWYNA